MLPAVLAYLMFMLLTFALVGGVGSVYLDVLAWFDKRRAEQRAE